MMFVKYKIIDYILCHKYYFCEVDDFVKIFCGNYMLAKLLST